jgi:hypothetical protein
MFTTLALHDGLARAVAAGDTWLLEWRERLAGRSVLPGDARP